MTDVEHELNGWLTYDREVSKIPADDLREMHLSLWDPPTLSPLIDEKSRWRCSEGGNVPRPDIPLELPRGTKRPSFGGEWCQPDFDDSDWDGGTGPFGVESDGPQLYLRRSLNIDEAPAKPVFYVACSNHCQLFINGTLVRNLGSNRYWQKPVETCVMLRPDELPLLRKGENLIAAVVLPSDRSLYLDVRMYDYADSN